MTIASMGHHLCQWIWLRGAAISRRIVWGKPWSHQILGFPNWFADNFRKYNGKEETTPIDQHLLTRSWLTPRSDLLFKCQTANQWLDQKVIFRHQTRKSSLTFWDLWKENPIPDKLLNPSSNSHQESVGYHIRWGKQQPNWEIGLIFLEFIPKKNLKWNRWSTDLFYQIYVKLTQNNSTHEDHSTSFPLFNRWHFPIRKNLLRSKSSDRVYLRIRHPSPRMHASTLVEDQRWNIGRLVWGTAGNESGCKHLHCSTVKFGKWAKSNTSSWWISGEIFDIHLDIQFYFQNKTEPTHTFYK